MSEQNPTKQEKRPSHEGTQQGTGKRPGAFLTLGKRKRAIARARFVPGKGIIRINNIPVDKVENEMFRLRLMEPLMIAGDVWKSWDVRVNVKGGGDTGQIDAARQAIARGLVKVKGEELKKKYMTLDRNLLVYDPRRTEPHKPPRSSQGPRRYKQRSKR